MKYSFLAVDLQNDFATEGGKHIRVKRPSVDFLKENLFPFLIERGIKINEIISDYRPPRLGDRGTGCVPGTWGYESVVPKEIVSSQWIKCMNSPVWIREHIGDQDAEPGLPYQDAAKFMNWVRQNIGGTSDTTIVLFGLTIDCCVLSTAQELSWHGYDVKILYEGVDHYKGTEEAKKMTMDFVVRNWANAIHWDELKVLL